jgi:2-amino-4-hydroxy-6-hydroxymethyldihydropteridine diphosphokinase
MEDRQEGIVRLDLDILAYDDERHHLSDWERHYIKILLPQLSL